MDTGCTQSIVSEVLADGQGGKGVVTVDGRIVHGVGEADVWLGIGGERLASRCLVMPNLVDGFKVIVGMDIITQLGGVSVHGDGVRFGRSFVSTEPRDACKTAASASAAPAAMAIDDKDMEAKFDGKKWTVGWKWRGETPVLSNKTSKYAMSPAIEQRFDEELEKWKAEGWLVPCEAPARGWLPLMAIDQPNKNKVRPVMDFRELNRYVESYTGDSDVCSETTRKWRMMEGSTALLDLRNAYLQLHVREDLQKFQVVQHRGQFFRLTRLGFGLSCAPKIMTAVLAKVLSLDPQINAATDHYIDDIIVDCDAVSRERVTLHLQRYGLETKPPEDMEEARVLGLQLRREPKHGLLWSRGNELPSVGEMQKTTRRELFSICGKLVGHYPVASWLRVACSYMKRHSEGLAWEDEVGDKVCGWLRGVVERLKVDDPVRGAWRVVANKDAKVWCDASSLALGVVIEMDGKVVEDASWLRKKEDSSHINVAELDAALRGVNLALKWKLKKMTLLTDSATVNGWLRSLLTGDHRVKVSGVAEMLVRRRLAMLGELRDAYGLDITVQLVRTEQNKADVLTRVPQAWLRQERPRSSLQEMHAQHHFGVRRSLYFARQVNPAVTRADVEAVVRACPDCASVDPAPTQWDKGELSVTNNWQRLAADVTHYGQDRYLTMVDCGPSRFAIWRKIHSEDASTVSAIFQQVFRERGPPTELLLDNSATFRSQELGDLCASWGVHRGFRCAYRPSGNGIVERNHRTVKSLAARAGKSPLDVLFWYNSAPLDDDVETVPAAAIYSYKWRNPDVPAQGGGQRCQDESRYTVGDVVFVKPAQARCTTRWPVGVVTAIPSTTCVKVDGMPRHVADCRQVPTTDQREEVHPEDPEDEEDEPEPRRSTRVRHAPVRFPEQDPNTLL